MQDKHDGIIDKTLSTLGSAQPPKGFEERIHQRLRYHSAEASRDGWRPGRAWWAGMLTGGALGTLMCCAVVLPGRIRSGGAPAIHASSGRQATPVAVSMDSIEKPAARPCAQTVVKRQPMRRVAVPRLVRTAAEVPKRVVPSVAEELTPQERELVRLTHVADRAELSTMSFEAKAKLDAQQSAAFHRFFTPPPPPPHDEGVNE